MPKGAFFDVEVDWNILEAEEQGVEVSEIEEETCTQNLELYLAQVDGHPGRFRLLEPFTFFGVCNVFNLGDIIEVTDLKGNQCSLTRIVKRGRPWCHEAFLPGSYDLLNEQPLKGLLGRFMEAGGAWECSTRKVKLQYPLTDGVDGPPAHILELANQITAALGPQSI